MSKQPEALRLADALADCETEYIANGAYGSAQGYYRTQNGVCDLDEAAAELLRLHSLNAELVDALECVEAEARHPDYDWPLWLSRQVSEVIAKAKEAQQ